MSLNHKAWGQKRYKSAAHLDAPSYVIFLQQKEYEFRPVLLEELVKMLSRSGLPPLYGYREGCFCHPLQFKIMWDIYVDITPLSPLVGASFG